MNKFTIKSIYDLQAHFPSQIQVEAIKRNLSLVGGEKEQSFLMLQGQVLLQSVLNDFNAMQALQSTDPVELYVHAVDQHLFETLDFVKKEALIVPESLQSLLIVTSTPEFYISAYMRDRLRGWVNPDTVIGVYSVTNETLTTYTPADLMPLIYNSASLDCNIVSSEEFARERTGRATHIARRKASPAETCIIAADGDNGVFVFPPLEALIDREAAFYFANDIGYISTEPVAGAFTPFRETGISRIRRELDQRKLKVNVFCYYSSGQTFEVPSFQEFDHIASYCGPNTPICFAVEHEGKVTIILSNLREILPFVPNQSEILKYLERLQPSTSNPSPPAPP